MKNWYLISLLVVLCTVCMWAGGSLVPILCMLLAAVLYMLYEIYHHGRR